MDLFSFLDEAPATDLAAADDIEDSVLSAAAPAAALEPALPPPTPTTEAVAASRKRRVRARSGSPAANAMDMDADGEAAAVPSADGVDGPNGRAPKKQRAGSPAPRVVDELEIEAKREVAVSAGLTGAPVEGGSARLELRHQVPSSFPRRSVTARLTF
jgi:hypothetical protein